MSIGTELSLEILTLLKTYVDRDKYINPHFLQEISVCVEAYYNLEDSTLDAKIRDMFER